MKPLDRWAHDFGYADFDTYIRAGGSIRDASRDIRERIRSLQDALKTIPVDPREPDAKTEDEPPDPDNAQVQGAEIA